MHLACFYGGPKDQQVSSRSGTPKEKLVIKKQLPYIYTNYGSSSPVKKEYVYELSRVICNKKYVYEHVETRSVHLKDIED